MLSIIHDSPNFSQDQDIHPPQLDDDECVNREVKFLSDGVEA